MQTAIRHRTFAPLKSPAPASRQIRSGGFTLGPGGAQASPKSWLGPKFSRILDTLWSIGSQKNYKI